MWSWWNSWKDFNHSVKTRKFLHFKVLIPHFLIENLRISKYNLPRFREKKTKIGRRKRLSNVGTKSLSNLPISLKRKHNMKDIVNMNVPSAKEAGQSVASNTKLFTIQNQNLRIYNREQFVNITRICCNNICYV